MQLNIKQKSIFVKLLISYILVILVISTLITIMVFSYARYNLEQEVISLNNSVLEEYTKIVDALVISETEKVVTDFMMNTGFTQLLARMAYAGDEALIPNYAIYQRLVEFVQPNQNFIKAIHLYNPSTQTIVSSLYGIKTVQNLPPLIRDNLDWIPLPEDFEKSWLSGREQRYSQTGEMRRFVTYLQKEQIMRPDLHAPIIIAVDIPEDIIMNIMHKHTTNSGETFLLTNGEGQIQFQLNRYIPEKELKKLITDFTTVSGSIHTSVIEDEKYITSRADISNGWHLYRLIPLQYFFKASNQLILNTLFISLFFILAGFVFAYFLSKYFYTPIAIIENRVQSLVGAQNKVSEKNKDEFIHINDALNDLDKTLTSFYQEQEEKVPRLKTEFIRNTLYGNYMDKETYLHHLELIHPKLGTHYCAVLLVHFNPNLESHFNKNRIIQSKMRAITLLEEASTEQISLLGTELNDLTLAFLCYTETLDSITPKNTQVFFMNLYGIYSEEISEKAVFSYGDFQSYYGKISDSYKKAEQAHKHRFFYPERFIFTPDLIKKNLDYDSKFFEKQNDHLKKAFLSEQYDQTREIIETSVTFLIQKPYSYISKELCLHTMTQIILGELFKLKITDEDLIEEQIVLYRKISNIREFTNWCEQIIELFKLNSRNDKKNQYSLMIKELKEFIDTHLSDDLSLTRLADLMKISKGYLSSIFFDMTGSPLNEYITLTRMEHARILLKSTDRKIAEIAQESGYYTPHYFSKIFKQYYGKTPQGYRLTEKNDSLT